ncbi:MAG: RNA polymerase subunit sigma-70, partial [Chloroflexi bacterium]|nr:RNA polymerase subunit sigma-70 [Chloroflexota bacterium]
MTADRAAAGIAAATPDEQMSQLEQYRVELTAYCYRMLGSGFEAEDAV